MSITGRTRMNRDRRRRTIAFRVVGLVLMFAFALPASGAVRRRLNVHSNPPGALVYVDNQQIGITPCSVDFTYYGTREVRLIKPGFETLTVNQPIPTPWYEYVPLDFVSENLLPTKIRDNRTVTYNLAPQLVVPTQELLDRANQLRQDSLQFPVVAGSANVPIGTAPGPIFAPASPVVSPPPSVVVPPTGGPEPLPGISPPPFGQPGGPQPIPAPPSAAVPIMPQAP